MDIQPEEDEPQNLEQTNQRITELFETTFAPTQQVALRMYDNYQTTTQNGYRTLVGCFLDVLDMVMTPQFTLQFRDGDGLHSGLEALDRAHAQYAYRIIQLQIALTRYDPHCPLLGNVGDQERGHPYYEHPATNSLQIRQFHRLQGLGEVAVRHLRTFTASMNLIDEQLFGMGLQHDGEFHWLTMQSSYFRMYGKQLTNGQMVEMFVGNMLVNEKLRINGEWIYEPEMVVRERPIVVFNEELQYNEYICSQCGLMESAHTYTEIRLDSEGHAIHQLLERKHRTNHPFRRLVMPLENHPKRFTGTYKRKCSVEEYVR